MRIAEALGVSVGYITDYDKRSEESKLYEEKQGALVKTLPQILAENGDQRFDHTKFFPAPIISEASLIADLEEFEEEDIEDYVFISAKWIEAPLDTGRYCCLWIKEEAKALPPLIEAGALICIDSYQREPSELEGEIVVFHDPKGGCSVKRLSFQGDHILGLPEESQHLPLVIPISAKEAVLGKVIWCWSKFEK